MTKKICLIILVAFSSFTSMQTIKAISTTRSQLPYEITSIQFSHNRILIDGWAIVQETQHFQNASTHSYRLIFKGQKSTKTVSGRLQSFSMTELMRYQGIRTCAAQEYYAAESSCNYTYENVGFHFDAALSDFDVTDHYELYLQVEAYSIRQTYEIALFYPQARPVSTMISDYQYQIDSSFQSTSLRISLDTVYARTGPNKAFPPIATGHNCSSGYGNSGYFLKGSDFTQILDKIIVDNISYYQVGAHDYGCVNGRSRVVAGNIYTTYIPSPYVDYWGEPARLTIRLINTAPKLTGDSVTVFANQPKVDIYSLMKAYDKEEGDLTARIQVIANTYTDHRPGVYTVTYRVTDKYGEIAEAALTITVLGAINNPPNLVAGNVVIKQYSLFDNLTNVYAFDQEDGEIPQYLIQYDRAIDTSVLGTHTQCFLVRDSESSEAQQCRFVSIEKNTTIASRFISIKSYPYFHSVLWKDKEQTILNCLENKQPLMQREIST